MVSNPNPEAKPDPVVTPRMPVVVSTNLRVPKRVWHL